MNQQNDIYPLLRRALLVSIQYLGIQQSATDILVILYLRRHTDNSARSIKEIMQETGLSLSSVSVLCSRLEAEGILIRQSDDSGMGRGRRKILYELAMGIDELLTLGIRKYMQEVARIYRDTKSQEKQMTHEDGHQRNLLRTMANELCSFLSDNSQFVTDSESLWLLSASNNGFDIKENSEKKSM